MGGIAEKATEKAKLTDAKVLQTKALAAQKSFIAKQSAFRQLALQQKAADVKLEIEKKNAIAERNRANANANKQFAEITKLKDKVTVTQEGKERECQKVRKMRKEGC